MEKISVKTPVLAPGTSISRVAEGSRSAQGAPNLGLLDGLDDFEAAVDGFGAGEGNDGLAGSLFEGLGEALADGLQHRQDVHHGAGPHGFNPNAWATISQSTQHAGASGDAGRASEEGLRGIDGDDMSVEQFSIAHPVWGQLDVDSRRSSQSWEVVVRCADPGTQQRLQSRETEFRQLLSREYGMSLAIDTQTGRRA